MTRIDKSKPVLVTGATGYVAGWLVKKLLEEGITVHAAVRDPKNKLKLQHLDALAANSKGSIRYFKADLLDKGSFAEAMEGCELVFHTASPFTNVVKDPQRELIDPALKGTEHVLAQANQTTSVKRVVITSSCAAIYSDARDVQETPNGVFDEGVWNTSSNLDYQPYSFSKTLAERKAWDMVEAQDRWDMVTVNPSLVLGPPLNPSQTTSESMDILKQMGDGTMKMGVPNLGIGLVDVQDLAEAHFAAGYTPDAEGRHIISAHNTCFLDLALILNQHFGKGYPIGTKPLPKWLLLLVGPLINKGLNRRFIKNNINEEWKADNSKGIQKLGLSYHSMEETMVDSFQAIIDAGLLKSSK